MKFRLFYDGPLKSNRGADDKQMLRRHFHRQLGELVDRKGMAHVKRLLDSHNAAATFLEVQGFEFAPLFTEKFLHVVKLNITMLTTAEPGSVVTQGGDIDNRLKTLFDALRAPKAGELPKGDAPREGESPFYCLLEDDALISGVSVETDRLLRSGGNASDVVLLIQVVPETTTATIGLTQWTMG